MAKCEARDMPAEAKEIEVTPEMIEAGVNILLDSDYGRDSTVSVELVVETIERTAIKDFLNLRKTSLGQ